MTGASGLVGSRFVGLSKYKSQLLTPDISELDILDSSSVDTYFKQNKVDVVINFAAFTDVAEGEKQRGNEDGLCYKLNVDGVFNLVNFFKENGGEYFIQISTDNVFSGQPDNPGPYDENAAPEIDAGLVTWYGYTKMLGEKVVGDNWENSSVVRINYPVRAKFEGKLDYFRKPLSLFDQNKLYPLFTDQHITITFIDELAAVLDKLIDLQLNGVFHVASANMGTPFEIISLLLQKARGVSGVVQKSSIVEFLRKPDVSKVRYPQFGGLKTQKTQEKLGMKFKTWQEVVDELVSQGIA